MVPLGKCYVSRKRVSILCLSTSRRTHSLMAGVDGIEAFHLDESFLDVTSDCFAQGQLHELRRFAEAYKLEQLRDLLKPEVQRQSEDVS